LVIGAVVIALTGGLGPASAVKGGGAVISGVRYVERHGHTSYFLGAEIDRGANVRKVQARLVRVGRPDVRGRADKGDCGQWGFRHKLNHAVRADLRGGKCRWPRSLEYCVAKVKVRALRGGKTLDRKSCKLELHDWSDPSETVYGATCDYPRDAH